MMLNFDVGSFLHRPKLFSEYHQNLKELALFCVDLTWNDPYTNVWPEGDVVLHVNQICCFVVFIVVLYSHTKFQFLIICHISQFLCIAWGHLLLF